MKIFKTYLQNVKNVLFVKNITNYMNLSVKPNFKNAGSIFGSKIKDFANYLTHLNEKEIISIQNGESKYFEDILINNDLIDVRISAKEGFNVASINNNFIILNTTITEDLLNEGLAREVVSKVQNLRKTLGFDVENRINIYYDANLDFDKHIKDYIPYIKDETLCVNLIKETLDTETTKINDYDVKFRLEKNNDSLSNSVDE